MKVNKELLNVLIPNMDKAISILESYREDFLPKSEHDEYDENLTEHFMSSSDEEKKARKQQVVKRVNKIVGKMPGGMFGLFLNCGHIASFAVFDTNNKNPQWMADYHSGWQFAEDSLYGNLMAGMMGVKGGLNLFEERLPFMYLLNTILGPDVIKVMTMESEEGVGKIQPHECSRQNWIRMQNMSGQVNIENELLYFDSIEPFNSKVVVAASWTMLSMMAAMDPDIFLSESKPHLSSARQYGMTVSYGKATHTFVNYYPRSLSKAIRILKEMLTIDSVSGFDMLWVANNIARIHSVQSGHGPAEEVANESFDLFLSHRGKDSKKDLMQELLNKRISNRSVFLDCLSIPRKLINRNFVFKSLVNSKKIIVIKSKNYEASKWCMKEETVAKLLEKYKVASLIYVKSASEAIKEINKGKYHTRNSGKKTKASTDKFDKDYTPWTTVRILKDGDDIQLAPNIVKVQQLKYPSNYFDEIINWVSGGSRKVAISELHKKSFQCITNMFEEIMNTKFKFKKGTDKNPAMIPVEVWATASQLSMAALSLGSNTYNKVHTRKYISISNSLCGEILGMVEYNAKDVQWKNKLFTLTILMNCAIALELAGDDFGSIVNNGISDLVKGRGLLKDGLILIDFRVPAKSDWDVLKLISVMVSKYDVGTLGILQDIAHPVHEKTVDGFNVEVLPCITFHPGMEAIYEWE